MFLPDKYALTVRAETPYLAATSFCVYLGIVEMYQTGQYTQKEVAAKYGVSARTVSAYLSGRNIKRFYVQSSKTFEATHATATKRQKG